MYFGSDFVALENQGSSVEGGTLSPSATLLDFQLRHNFLIKRSSLDSVNCIAQRVLLCNRWRQEYGFLCGLHSTLSSIWVRKGGRWERARGATCWWCCTKNWAGQFYCPLPSFLSFLQWHICKISACLWLVSGLVWFIKKCTNRTFRWYLTL